jgi:hypothetical protein
MKPTKESEKYALQLWHIETDGLVARGTPAYKAAHADFESEMHRVIMLFARHLALYRVYCDVVRGMAK